MATIYTVAMSSVNLDYDVIKYFKFYFMINYYVVQHF